MAFLVKYVDGTDRHGEWVHPTVAIDQERAASGDPHYKPGRIYQPHEALGVLTLATFFDPSLTVVDLQLVHPITDHHILGVPLHGIDHEPHTS